MKIPSRSSLMKIRDFKPDDLPQVIDLSLRAWAPVFESIRASMDEDVYRSQYPDGWRKSQSDAVELTCSSDEIKTWVAEVDGDVVGFSSAKTDRSSRMGEIYMIAVDPDYQQKGIGAELTYKSLAWLKESGMETAMVETGGDPGHEAARRTYESRGFRLFPIARYFRKL